MTHKVKTWLRFQDVTDFVYAKQVIALTGLSFDEFINYSIMKEMGRVIAKAKKEQENARSTNSEPEGNIVDQGNSQNADSAGLENAASSVDTDTPGASELRPE
jgi:hypothetical protein